MGAHDKAARLLVRVANNISKFPSRELMHDKMFVLLFYYRYCSNININSNRMPTFWTQGVCIQLCCHVNETRIPLTY